MDAMWTQSFLVLRRTSSVHNVGKQQRSYMNVHTRPSHSGMFDKKYPPKPPPPERSRGMKLSLFTMVVIGLYYCANYAKDEKVERVINDA